MQLLFLFFQLETLVKALCAIRDKDPSTKSLVVSQFTSFLDIIEDALREQDIMFVRLDGRMTQEARASAINTFSDPSSSSPTVFLLSLTAGGVGLNLTAATRVFLLDPVGSFSLLKTATFKVQFTGKTNSTTRTYMYCSIAFISMIRI